MRCGVMLALLLVAGCSRDTSDAGPRAAAAVAAIALQTEEYKSLRLANSAPAIELDYRMPASAPAGQPLNVELILNTPQDSGAMIVTIAEQDGVTLLGDAIRPIDLSRAERPVRLPLRIMPGAQVQRSLQVSVAIEAGGEKQSRNFPINLPPLE